MRGKAARWPNPTSRLGREETKCQGLELNMANVSENNIRELFGAELKYGWCYAQRIKARPTTRESKIADTLSTSQMRAKNLSVQRKVTGACPSCFLGTQYFHVYCCHEGFVF